MPTFNTMIPFSSSGNHQSGTNQAGIRNSANFVSTDAAALASHMSRCATSRSRFFGLHAALESAQSLVFPRMVTATVISIVLLVLVGII